MKSVEDLIPWKVTDISFRPHKGIWSMNICRGTRGFMAGLSSCMECRLGETSLSAVLVILHPIAALS